MGHPQRLENVQAGAATLEPPLSLKWLYITAINVPNSSLTQSNIVTLVRFELGSPQQEKRVLTTRPAGRQGTPHYAIYFFWNFRNFIPPSGIKARKYSKMVSRKRKLPQKAPKTQFTLSQPKKHGHAKVHDADV
jgi:hypothetical protein